MDQTPMPQVRIHGLRETPLPNQAVSESTPVITVFWRDFDRLLKSHLSCLISAESIEKEPEISTRRGILG